MALKVLLESKIEIESRGSWTRFAWLGERGCPRTMSKLGECFNGPSPATIHRTSRTTSDLNFRYTQSFGSVTCSAYHRSHHPDTCRLLLQAMSTCYQAILSIRFRQLAEVVARVRDGAGKRRMKSTQLSSFVSSHRLNRRDTRKLPFPSSKPHDDRYAEKPPEKRSLVRPAEKRRLRR